jgi:hypothetical protein
LVAPLIVALVNPDEHDFATTSAGPDALALLSAIGAPSPIAAAAASATYLRRNLIRLLLARKPASAAPAP